MHNYQRAVSVATDDCGKNEENIDQRQRHSFHQRRLIPETIMEPHECFCDLRDGECSGVCQKDMALIEHPTDDTIKGIHKEEGVGDSKLTTSSHSGVINKRCYDEMVSLVETNFSNNNSILAPSSKKARVTPSTRTISSDEEYEISLLRSFDDSPSTIQEGEKAILNLMKSQSLLPRSFLPDPLHGGNSQTINTPTVTVASTLHVSTENLDNNQHAQTPALKFRNYNSFLPVTLTARDVLLGRGIKCNSLPGNRLFRKLVDEKKELYFQQGKNREAKNAISHQVMQTVHSYGGRFLEMTSINPLKYEEVDEARAIKKCSQRLRERGPKTDR